MNLRPPGYEPDELPDCSIPRRVGEGGFEPPKAQLTDLQSAPFGHSGIPPDEVPAPNTVKTEASKPIFGLEPKTC